MVVTAAPGQDRLAITAIGFLTSVARSVHFALFGDEAALRQVCEGIVVPNLRLRPDDEEAFEFNWIEYVRRDVEGSDNDTRRRAAAELLRALVDKFPQETTTICGGYITALLQEAARDWRAKDAAMQLVTALAVKGKTAAAGATSVNQLVDLNDFYTQHVAPELADANVDAKPVVKADALRFATTFRSQLPKPVALDLFARCAALLRSQSNVVHSYAAILVERLLASKENGQPRFASTELGPQLQPILEALFAALQLAESGENEYVMRAVTRLVAFVGPLIAPVAPAALRQLSNVLVAVCQNPTQPGFNHFMFEAVAALVKFSCAADASNLALCEEVLFPPFQLVLQQDVQEFHPYVFQILALLIEQRPPGTTLPATYMQLLAPLLSPVFWERSGNIPALVRMLRAYTTVAAKEVAAAGHLPATLGVFQKLVSSKAHDHEGMMVLDSLICGLDHATLAPYISGIWGILFQRLQSARTNKFTRCFVYSVALMVLKQGGAAAVLQSMDSVQPGIGIMVLQGVWLPTLALIHGGTEEKVVAVGTVAMLCDAPQLSTAETATLWGQLLDGVLLGVSGTSTANGDGAAGAVPEEEEAPEEFTGYSAAFARLQHAQRVEPDPLPEVPDVAAHIVRSLAAYAAKNPGRVGPLIQAHVRPEMQQKLQQLLQQAGVTLA